MRTILVFAVLVVILSVGTQVSAQTPTSVAKDPQAVAVLTQSLNAAGGLVAVSGIQDFTATGNVTYFWAAEQTQVPVTVRGMGISNFRIDAVLPTGTRTWAASGYVGVLINPDGTRRSSAFYNLMTAGSMTMPYVRIASVLTDSTTSITYVGSVSVNGQQAYQIHFVEGLDPSIATSSALLPGLGSFDLYINPSSLLITELIETVRSESNFNTTLTHEIDFANYQTFGNTSMPCTIIEKINGQETWSVAISSVVFNSGLTIAEFNP